MSVLFIALPIALLLGASGMLACVYCIRNGQYEDLDTPSIRILIDDADSKQKSSANNVQE
jgi:cbb3-type cytochrome oxidase maturation protein